MSARAFMIALLTVVASSPSQAQPQAPQGEAKPTEARCRAYVEQGLAKTNHDEARELFHAARVRCANPLSLIYIARTYEQQGDLPRALAYIEEFLAVVDPAHESRAAMEQAAAALRERVPAAQRVSIAAELSGKSETPVAAEPPATTATPVAAEPSGTSARPNAVNYETAKTRLIEQVEDVDYRSRPGGRGGAIGRPRGLFVGANLAYATRATIEVRRDNMNGRVDFPAVFAAEVQAGYRIFPFLSVALAPQMLFNLKPNEVDTAHEVGLFVETTGHLALRRQWDFNVLVAPGYSVVIIPGADNAKGMAFRWGGGPMFHLSNHISFAAEFSHQVGFQDAERESGDVDMQTSFFSLLAGVRLRL